MVTEEDIKRIRKRVIDSHKKHPNAMFRAFCMVYADTVAKEYNDFMDGLENEFTRKERLRIMQGIMERKAHFWENSDFEELYEMSCRILKEFDKQRSQKKVK